jgi:hypothetical protein
MGESAAAVTFGLVGVGQLAGRLGTTFFLNWLPHRVRADVIGAATAVLPALIAIIPAPRESSSASRSLSEPSEAPSPSCKQPPWPTGGE